MNFFTDYCNVKLYIGSKSKLLDKKAVKSKRLFTFERHKGGQMAKLIPAAERIVRARKLIQQAREFPVPPELGKNDLSYIAGVKDLLRQARDLVKFIPQTVGVSAEMKEEVRKIYGEAEQANREILY
jgi:hypothetical protein